MISFQLPARRDLNRRPKSWVVAAFLARSMSTCVPFGLPWSDPDYRLYRPFPGGRRFGRVVATLRSIRSRVRMDDRHDHFQVNGNVHWLQVH